VAAELFEIVYLNFNSTRLRSLGQRDSRRWWSV